MSSDPFSEKLGTGRIRFIDTLRGMTMILVVYTHIILNTGVSEAFGSPLSLFFQSFRMPMFFFISGFISYKPCHRWTLDLYRTKIYDKACVQMIPTVVFFVLNWVLIDSWPTYEWPGGYWFTLALFIMFLFYFTIAFIFKKQRPWVENVALCGLAIALRIIIGKFYCPEMESVALCKVGIFFPYFIAGLMMRKYVESTSKCKISESV